MPAIRKTVPLNTKELGYDRTALVLQGGGALGAYQAGVYQALCAHGLEMDWIAGISIGAINAALIAGNRPEDRFDRLTAFWETVTAEHTTLPWQSLLTPFARGNRARNALSRIRRLDGTYAWSAGLLPTAAGSPLVAAGRHGRGDQLLRHRPAAGDAGAVDRL